MKATVLFNEGEGRFRLFDPATAALREAFTFTGLDLGLSGTVADAVFALANVDDAAHLRAVEPHLARLADQVTAYRAARNRSLSVGDVVLIAEDDGSGEVALACDSFSWRHLDEIPTYVAGLPGGFSISRM